jgi:Na+/H+ antiporter NhaD/arsenite permease-like protein
MLIVVLIFIVGYLAIVFEHPLKLDKTVPALAMAALCWAALNMLHLDLFDHHGKLVSDTDEFHSRSSVLLHHIGKTAEILVFLIGAMTIVELIDLHGGFSTITERIKTSKKSSMLWIISVLAFFLSAVLDNLTCVIVIVSLLRRLVPLKEERIYYVCIAVIAANAGGAWSPIGDVTTTMLWIGERVTSAGLVLALFVPSVICTIVPILIVSRLKAMKGNITIPEGNENSMSQKKKGKGANLMFLIGVGGLLFVPIFKTITHLPPYVGIMLSLAFVWFVSERIQSSEIFEDKHHYSAHNALSRIEMSSILFFLGILMAVGALESLHLLANLASTMDAALPSNKEFLPGLNGLDIVVSLLGIASAIIDNVPLVAAAMGMYSNDVYTVDTKVWQFLAYTAGTGGSMLIIGSAAGVAAMGMEKIDFVWYLRKFSWIAFIGFVAGAIIFLFMWPFIEPLLNNFNSGSIPVEKGPH